MCIRDRFQDEEEDSAVCEPCVTQIDILQEGVRQEECRVLACQESVSAPTWIILHARLTWTTLFTYEVVLIVFSHGVRTQITNVQQDNLNDGSPANDR